MTKGRFVAAFIVFLAIWGTVKSFDLNRIQPEPDYTALISDTNSFYKLKDVPLTNQTQDLMKVVVKRYPNTIFDIPFSRRTTGLALIALENWNSGDYVELTPNGIKYWPFLRGIPIWYRSKELCEEAVKKNGNNLAFVPAELRTREVIRMAFENNPQSAVKVVSLRPETEEFYLIALRKVPWILQDIPEEKVTRPMLSAILDSDWSGWYASIADYPVSDRALALRAVKKDWRVLDNLVQKRLDLLDEEIFLAAVKSNAAALQYVPPKLVSQKICVAALEQGSEDAIPCAMLYILAGSPQDKQQLLALATHMDISGLR